MIPLRAEDRLPGRPFLTWSLMAICMLALVRLALQPAGDQTAIVSALAVVPARLLADPTSPGQLITLLSFSFLHAGWVHLAGNVLYLAVFGPAVEARLGRLRFLVLYLCAGVVGGLAHVFAQPQSVAPLVGASGAIAGLLGAHLVLSPRGRITTVIPVVVFFEVASLPAAFVIALWFVAQLASGIAPVAGSSGAESIAWFAHLGGFSAGMLLAAPVAIAGAWKARGHRRRRTSAKSSRRRAA